MKEIVDKIDKLDDRLDNIDKHLAVYNQQLKEHIRRTTLLEKDVEPIKAHVAVVSSLSKTVTITSILLGIIASVGKLFGKW